jgi:ketosteroid isomerase-like protein
MKPLVLILLFSLFSCDLKFRKDDERVKALNEMQQTDVDFSNLAKEQGFRKAFLEYMAEDGILLRDNNRPIVGAKAIQYISSINDSTFKLDWDPQGGDMAKSGDMGFTYGLYTLTGDTSQQEGTYITVWRKQADGKWKFLLDASTQGLGQLVLDQE